MRAAAIAVLVLASSALSAEAQWLYQKEESAFGDNHFHGAITGKGPYGFGFRCFGSDPEIIFMTPETSPGEEKLSLINSITPPEILIRTDDLEVHRLEGQAADTDGTVVFLAPAPAEVMAEVRDARRRVAVAIDFMGETIHETKFNVSGSTRAMAQLMRGCGVEVQD